MDGGGTRQRLTTTDGLHLSNKTTKDDEWLLVLDLSEEDPLSEKKKKLLEDKGFDPLEHASLKNTSCPSWLDTTMQILVQRARIIALDEVEFYFDGTDMDSMEFCNPRIELEALHSILSLVDKILSTGNYTTMGPLRDLRDATVNMIQELGNMIGLETTVVTSYSCDKEGHLLEWGKNNGIQTKLAVAYVEGAGRGAIATEDLNVGDIALDIPISVIISEELVQESDMCPILEKVNGMSSETMLLLWSMRERHNRHSKFKLYFDSLPEVFNTGLSFGINAIMALDGTLLLEEIVQAKEHLRAQYDELFPALCLEHPYIFPADLCTWEQFLWACELWYSNSMKIMFTDGKLRTCLVPVAGFLNHSLFPHIMHYGKVDAASNSLKFPLRRPCKAGEQCYLSYGKFSSSHLVTFYGFLPHGDNPYDIIPLDIDTPETGYCENGDPISDWSNHMVRGTWLSKNHGIFHYGLPTPLLDHFRRALCPTFQTNIHSQENLEIELQVLDDLHSTFEDMLETFGETNIDESESWDMKLAMEFKALQRRIISSIVTSCNSGRKLVEQELGKWRT